MDVHEAIDAWQAQYSGQPPVGFMLRFTHEAVWTRIHYLRDGAEGETAETHEKTIVSRFDAISSALFTGTTVLVLGIHLDPGREETEELRTMGASAITPPQGWLEALGDYLTDTNRAEFVATTLSWQRGCMDRTWLAVARERIGRIAVFCPATGDAFLPYGGGADIFVWGAERRSKLGERIRAWLPGQGISGSLAARQTGMVAERG
jgi:hypothetical protein